MNKRKLPKLNIKKQVTILKQVNKSLRNRIENLLEDHTCAMANANIEFSKVLLTVKKERDMWKEKYYRFTEKEEDESQLKLLLEKLRQFRG